MKFFFSLSICLILACSAFASNSTGSTTPQGQLDNIFFTPLGTIAPVMAKCTGGGAEQCFRTAETAATANHTAIIFGGVSQPPQLNNQWLMSTGDYVNLFTWGGGAIDYNSARSSGGSAAQYILVNSQTEAQTAPGAAAIDMHGVRQFNGNGVYIWGTSLSEPSTILENSAQTSICCASNNLTWTGGAFGSTNAVFGSPLDGDLKPIQAGGVYSGTIVGGSGYLPGTYNKVALIGGTGTTAFADTITVNGSGVVSAVLLRDSIGIQYPGKNYIVGDVLSATDASLGGGGGSGFTFTVTGITKATSTAANVLPRFLGTQFSDVGTTLMSNNFSDPMIWNFQVSGLGGVAFQPIFGGGGGDYGPGRAEFLEKFGIWGGPNGSSINSSRIHDITCDFCGQSYDTAYRTLDRTPFEFDSGEGYQMSNIQIYRSPWTGPIVKIGGTGANAKLKNFSLVNFNYPSLFGPGSNLECIQVNNGGDGTVPDGVILDDIQCFPGNGADAVQLNVVPTHYFVNSFAAGSQMYWDTTGRPNGVSDVNATTPPSSFATVDYSGSVKAIALPSGTVGQRPGTPINGMIRYDSSGTPAVEAYINSAWASLLATTATTISATGSMTLTNGLIVNWGPWTSAGSQAAVAVTYNTAFTSATYAVLPSCASASTTSAQTWYDTPANGGVNLRSQVGSLSCTYLAIGK